MWNDCEVLLINAAMFGNSVEKIRATILFKDSRIANKNISVYEVNPNNFSRLLVQQSPCQPCTNGTGYIYCLGSCSWNSSVRRSSVPFSRFSR